MPNDRRRRQILKTVLVLTLVLAGVASFFAGLHHFSQPETYAETIRSLDEKKATATELMASATAASTLLTLIPGDTATPLAEQLTDMSTCFLAVICAILLEKYLLTVIGFSTFSIVIPIAFLIGAVWVLTGKERVGRVAVSVFLFGIMNCVVIPLSVQVSDLIETTYQASISETITSARQELHQEEEPPQDTEDTEKQEGLFSGFVDKVKDGVTGVVTGVSDSAKALLQQAQQKINALLESFAVMIVTSCIIPVIVVVFFVQLGKLIVTLCIEFMKKNL